MAGDLDLAEHIQLPPGTGYGLVGVSLDFAKAFDRLPQGILLRLMEEMGMDSSILRALRGMYCSLERRFKVGQHLGSSFTSSNGILQGCPISVLLLNAFVETWARAVQEEAGPGCTPQGYADDIGAIAFRTSEVIATCKTTEEYSDLTGMEVSVKKSGVWGPPPALRLELVGRCTIHDTALPLLVEDRRLGAFLSYRRKRARSRIARTLEECRRMCERIADLPLPLMPRAQIVAIQVLSKALYACGASPPTKRDLQTLRAAAAKATWEMESQ